MTKVLVTGLNNNQLPYLKELKKLNLKIIGTDQNKEAVGKQFVNSFYNCGYTDSKRLIEICKSENFTHKDKVFTASSQISYLALSEVAEYFSIPFPRKSFVEIAIGKKKLYEFFQKNNVPFPKTEFIYSKEQLICCLKYKNYYLKSDYSKNPHYVYKVKKGNLDLNNVVWTKDRYLKECYILQEEFVGTHLRFNIFNSYFTVFPFNSQLAIGKGQVKKEVIDKIKQLKIPSVLKYVVDKLKFNNLLVKFDVISKDNRFVVLDIGIDPPYRMRKHYELQNLNFAEMYVKHYILGKIEYPDKEQI
jgi:hypothetical protein